VGLAYQLNGGCSDDGFVSSAAGCWLLAQGRGQAVYAKRFTAWPGLAPPGEAGRDPDTVAREVVAATVPARLRSSLTPAFLGLVPVDRSADLSAIFGFAMAASDVTSDHEVSTVLRSWEQRFGAQVVALTNGIYVSVAAPPVTREHAEHLALEHLLLCPENLWNQGDWTFPGYVDRILGAELWKFSWDD
jgi:hypothetical protein